MVRIIFDDTLWVECDNPVCDSIAKADSYDTYIGWSFDFVDAISTASCSFECRARLVDAGVIPS